MKDLNIYDLIIVGGGPAAIFSALKIKSDKKVLLLEKNNKLLSKFLLSGSGKCNLTHSGNWEDFSGCYGNNSRFFKNAFYNFNNMDLLEFFKKKGIEFHQTEAGKFFPICESAKVLASLLIEELLKTNIEIKYESPLINITKTTDLFKISTNIEQFYSKKIILATGGKSFPKTGSEGEIIPLLKKMGQKVNPLFPSLASIEIEEFELSNLSGISFDNSKIIVERDNKIVLRSSGELLITHKGFSGPLILNNSRYMRDNDLILLSFNNIDQNKFKQNLITLKTENPKKELQTLLKKLNIPSKFSLYICDKIKKENKLNALEVGNLSNKIINKISILFCNYSVKISKCGRFETAMATTGGVATSSINPKTMESKDIEGLFFAGELIDLDGDTGGYNLQVAFSTGALAGEKVFN